MSNRAKPMRQVMPECSAFVDAFRDAGLTDDATIKAGLQDGSCWFAEAGHYIGKPGAREASERMSAAAIKGDAIAMDTAADKALLARNRKARCL